MSGEGPKIIVALDGLSSEAAYALASNLLELDVLVKVNDLLDYPGPNIIGQLVEGGLGVMADPKFHDIPNTVGNRVLKLSQYRPTFITVHASGGIEMMRKAVESAKLYSSILAVTVLTSLGEEECHLNFGGPVKAKVLQFSRNAVLAGVHGIVCSGQELEFLAKFPELANLTKVVPGIRPKWHVKADDQKRVVTPADAVRCGADYLVIGRPIVEANDPVEAIKRTQQEIAEAVDREAETQLFERR